MINKIYLSLKMQLRVPVALFFALFFPIMMMVVMMTAYGNFSIGGGYRFIDKYFLISTSIGILPTTLISFSIWIGDYFDQDYLKRMKFFNINIIQSVIADIIANFMVCVVSLLLNIICAKLFYNLNIPDLPYFISFTLNMLYGMIPLLILGAIIGSIFRNKLVILPFSMVLMFLIYMLIGALIPFAQLPEMLKNIAGGIPMKYIANDFFYIWSNKEIVINKFVLLNSIFVCLELLILFIVVNRRKKYVKKI